MTRRDSRPNLGPMNLIALTVDQRDAIVATIARYDNRPTSKEYAAEEAVLRIIRVNPKPKVKDIPNTRKGYNAGDIKPQPGFDAQYDLPQGWALVSCLDSGGNHRLDNAALAVWRQVWNGWPSVGPYTREIMPNGPAKPDPVPTITVTARSKGSTSWNVKLP